jgi:type II secretory pathway predicted ATPase ExeA
MGEGFQEYLEYWGLERPAFSLAPCPDTLFLSRQHAECLIRLKYSILSRKGGALLISEHAGDGKTAILGRLSRRLHRPPDAHTDPNAPGDLAADRDREAVQD